MQLIPIMAMSRMNADEAGDAQYSRDALHLSIGSFHVDAETRRNLVRKLW